MILYIHKFCCFVLFLCKNFVFITVLRPRTHVHAKFNRTNHMTSSIPSIISIFRSALWLCAHRTNSNYNSQQNIRNVPLFTISRENHLITTCSRLRFTSEGIALMQFERQKLRSTNAVRKTKTSIY